MIDLIAIENNLPALQVVIPLLLAPVAILVSLPFCDLLNVVSVQCLRLRIYDAFLSYNPLLFPPIIYHYTEL